MIARIGYRSSNGIILLDFLESGVEHEPYFNPSIDPNQNLMSLVKKSIPFADHETVHLTAKKIAEMESVDAPSAWSVKKAVELFSWNLVSPTLIEVPDEDTNLDIPSEKLVLLAVRSGRRIQINRLLWNELLPAQRTGLLFHELIYALVPLENLGLGRGIGQSSPKARGLVGYLFSPRFGLLDRENFIRQSESILFTVSTEFESYKFEGSILSIRKEWNFSTFVTNYPTAVIFPFKENNSLMTEQICASSWSDDFDQNLFVRFRQFSYAYYFSRFQDVNGRDREYLSLKQIADVRGAGKEKFLLPSPFSSEKSCFNKIVNIIYPLWKSEATRDGFQIY